MTSAPLNPAQTHALFDILIHLQLYSEIEAFKYPQAISTYGYPFRKQDGVQTTSPLLQTMLNKFALRLPGLNKVGLDFWQDKVQVLVAKLGEAELSESYDKGAIGARKALSTALSSMLEYVARGMLGGWPKGQRKEEGEESVYDTRRAEDILRAWDDAVREVIHGDLLEEAFKKTGETGRLQDHSSLVQGAHEYLVLNLASLLHHVFIMSPDGQYILRLIENVHRLIPYYVVKQTLRVGNAATMINGMVRLVLTKLSVTAVTNWIGLTNNSNDGMNLMQQIISTVMAWDTAEFQRRAQKLESQRNAPDKRVFKTIRSYVYASRDTHEAGRNISIQESKSIICVILETASPPIEPDSLTAHQHDIAMEHYSTLLSIRDREELTKVLCKMQPDLLTSAIRDLVSAFDPIIRAVHNAVDLSGTVTDAENFLTDLIRTSKPKDVNSGTADGTAHARSITDTTAAGTPTVEDYVQLLRKHMPSAHKFCHQVVKNAPELSKQYLDFARTCVSEFRVHDSSPLPTNGQATQASNITEGGAGNLTPTLHTLFSSLPTEKQGHLKGLLDQHARHLQHLKSVSHSRMEVLVRSTSRPLSPSTTASHSDNTHMAIDPKHHANGTNHGPGVYLSRWHALLDNTLITPATLHGPVRRGYEVKGELDGKGLKTESLLQSKQQKKGSRSRRNSINFSDGTGDLRVHGERKREEHEEEKIAVVWTTMRDAWVGVSRGLEVLGD